MAFVVTQLFFIDVCIRAQKKRKKKTVLSLGAPDRIIQKKTVWRFFCFCFVLWCFSPLGQRVSRPSASSYYLTLHSTDTHVRTYVQFTSISISIRSCVWGITISLVDGGNCGREWWLDRVEFFFRVPPLSFFFSHRRRSSASSRSVSCCCCCFSGRDGKEGEGERRCNSYNNTAVTKVGNW